MSRLENTVGSAISVAFIRGYILRLHLMPMWLTWSPGAIPLLRETRGSQALSDFTAYFPLCICFMDIPSGRRPRAALMVSLFRRCLMALLTRQVKSSKNLAIKSPQWSVQGSQSYFPRLDWTRLAIGIISNRASWNKCFN